VNSSVNREGKSDTAQTPTELAPDSAQTQTELTLDSDKNSAWTRTELAPDSDRDSVQTRTDWREQGYILQLVYLGRPLGLRYQKLLNTVFKIHLSIQKAPLEIHLKWFDTIVDFWYRSIHDYMDLAPGSWKVKILTLKTQIFYRVVFSWMTECRRSLSMVMLSTCDLPDQEIWSLFIQ
jgi:hypothetical protein